MVFLYFQDEIRGIGGGELDEFLTQGIDVLIDFFVESQAQTDLIIGVHGAGG